MRQKRIMLVAGEPSGDALGAHLMRAMKALAGDTVRVTGVGGELMAAEGLESIFPMDTLSVMGLFEILPRYPAIRRCFREAEAFARAERPDLILTIDSPGFNKRLIARLQDLDTVKVHYVAPSVWAWRPKRAEKMAQLYDHLLTLLPFEPPLFEREGLPSTFVGHPAVEAEHRFKGDPRRFRADIGAPPHGPLINVLFGSRLGEVRRLGPVFVDALRRLHSNVPVGRIVSPTLPHLREEVEGLLKRQPYDFTVVGSDAKMDSFHAADVALAASGTVALETGLAGLPTVVAYRLNPLTAMIAKRLIRIEYASLMNILLDRAVVPELLQEHCSGPEIAAWLEKLLTDPVHRDAQIEAGNLVRDMLKPGSLWPSAKAARVVLNLADRTSGGET
ncbi:MAG: lipid-A-disaccharide synthase [Minwuia sp.]|uniref:lipid-A-disaccharide synthase n=1 Tax=Minwuia sp. TaxID=2493630 RepID=UPI003A870BE1